MTKLDLIVAKVRPLTERISEFTLQAADRGALPEWEAGAHIRVDVDGGDRAYSLIRFAPGDGGDYRIAVQREDDGAGGSRFMHGLKDGDRIVATPPKCDFPVVDGEAAVLLAGESGSRRSSRWPPSCTRRMCRSSCIMPGAAGGDGVCRRSFGTFRRCRDGALRR